MNWNEALKNLDDLIDDAYDWMDDPDKTENKKALSVLRAVVEDYEKARPLLEAAMSYMGKVDEKTGIIHGGDVHALAYVAIAYREGRKP